MVWDTWKTKIAQMRHALDTPGCPCPYDLDDLVQEVTRYLLDNVLNLKAELPPLYQGTPFSRFSQEEIRIVRRKDKTIADIMEQFWFEDEEYCMRMDFICEDFRDDLECGSTACQTIEEYHAELKRHYQKGILSALEELVEYAGKRDE